MREVHSLTSHSSAGTLSDSGFVTKSLHGKLQKGLKRLGLKNMETRIDEKLRRGIFILAHLESAYYSEATVAVRRVYHADFPHF
jgi:hypothetical protein